MSEEMTRKEVIWQLKGLLLGELRTTTKERKALEYAIASLETDEAYQLEYEQPEFCEDCISREDACEVIKSAWTIDDLDNLTEAMLVDAIKDLPSVLPKATKDDLGVDKPTIIDWNNCHTSEQLEGIPTTKNDLGVDCISRKQAIDAFPNLLPNMGYNKKAITEILQELPSVTPQEPKTGHWIDREVYDADRWKCSECGRTEQWKENFCPNCGAKMVEPQESEDKE